MSKHGIFPFDIKTQEIPVFKVGYYPQLETPSNPFGLADDNLLRELVSSYDSSVFMAPITTDHEHFGPALGRVKGFSVKGDTLFATIFADSVDSEFEDGLNTGKWLYPSIEIFFPSNLGNPTPGRFSVKAITWLGAATPQVKGLFTGEFKGFPEPWIYVDPDGQRIACLSEFNRKDKSTMDEKELKAKLDKAKSTATKEATEKAEAKFSEDRDKFKADLKKQTEANKKLENKVSDLSGEKSAEFKEIADENLKLKTKFEKLEKSIDEREATDRKKSVAAFCTEMKSKGWFSPSIVDEKMRPRLDKLVDSPGSLKEAMAAYRDSSTAKAFFNEQSSPHNVASFELKNGEKVTTRQEKLVASFAQPQVQGDPATVGDCNIAIDGFARFNDAQNKKPETDKVKLYLSLRESMVSASMSAERSAA